MKGKQSSRPHKATYLKVSHLTKKIAQAAETMDAKEATCHLQINTTLTGNQAQEWAIIRENVDMLGLTEQKVVDEVLREGMTVIFQKIWAMISINTIKLAKENADVDLADEAAEEAENINRPGSH